MKSKRSWRVEWAIGGLLLLPFAVAKPPLHPRSSSVDGAALPVRHGSIAERRVHESLSRRTRNISTTLSDSDRGHYEPSFIKTSRLSEPSLPEYPMDDVSIKDALSDAQPHVTEPESDVDSIWSRHPSNHAPGRGETELPHENHEEKLAHSPVVYQYFGRSRSRVHTADSIPFILLGPTVDHWKTVGQTLASRGFSVMACEIVEEREKAGQDQGKNLILAVLDALRWNRAILVGCDSEAAMVIEAAIQLAPERVKGLVLCGDLSSADKLARRAAAVDTERLTKSQKPEEDKKRHVALDSLLNAYLECPYTIIWDGDIEQAPLKASGDSQAYSTNSGDMFRYNRCLILGGGTAPHRRRPEQFAWALTRFVEEKVAPRSVPLQIRSADNSTPCEKRGVWRFCIPEVVENIFSQGSLLVTGRVVASVIFYVTAMKIAVYQYDSLRGGVVSINSLVQCMRTSKQRVFQSTGSFIRNYGYVFTLFSRRGSREVEIVEDNALEERTTSEGEVEENGGSDVHAPVDEDRKAEAGDQDLEDGEPKSQEGEPEANEPPQRLMLLDLVVV